MWQQTINMKIKNQAAMLDAIGVETKNMAYWADSVKSGDPNNYEARAAVYYWANIFPDIDHFKRDRYGDTPNSLLNYGYAILRGIVARSLVGSGLLTALGIHHRNKYNPYCLADDIMEPYRPYVDLIVCEIMAEGTENEGLSKENKIQLLSIATMDVMMDEQKSPLMIAVQRTTASVRKCFEGESRKIIYPKLASDYDKSF
jgi:CRISPR-associated protein Cas1